MSNRPAPRSALCVYSLKSIRRKFMHNIQKCFSGEGHRGLNFMSPSLPCVHTVSATPFVHQICVTRIFKLLRFKFQGFVPCVLKFFSSSCMPTTVIPTDGSTNNNNRIIFFLNFPNNTDIANDWRRLLWSRRQHSIGRWRGSDWTARLHHEQCPLDGRSCYIDW